MRSITAIVIFLAGAGIAQAQSFGGGRTFPPNIQVTTASLPAQIMFEGENISLLANDTGYALLTQVIKNQSDLQSGAVLHVASASFVTQLIVYGGLIALDGVVMRNAVGDCARFFFNIEKTLEQEDVSPCPVLP